MVLNLIFLGPPGTGKGTVAQAVMEQYKLVQLSTGDLIRAEVASGSEFGKKLSEIINAGHLVPDDLMEPIFEKELARLVAKSDFNGFILDGFPRTIPQIAMLDRILVKIKQKLSAVIYIESSKDSVVMRLSGRRTCPKCKKVYNIITDPKPKVGEICDIDGTKLIQRDDDKPETVGKRFEVYLKQTHPLIEHYEKTGLLKKYDGNVPLPKSIAEAKKLIAKVAKLK